MNLQTTDDTEEGDSPRPSHHSPSLTLWGAKLISCSALPANALRGSTQWLSEVTPQLWVLRNPCVVNGVSSQCVQICCVFFDPSPGVTSYFSLFMSLWRMEHITHSFGSRTFSNVLTCFSFFFCPRLTGGAALQRRPSLSLQLLFLIRFHITARTTSLTTRCDSVFFLSPQNPVGREYFLPLCLPLPFPLVVVVGSLPASIKVNGP